MSAFVSPWTPLLERSLRLPVAVPFLGKAREVSAVSCVSCVSQPHPPFIRSVFLGFLVFLAFLSPTHHVMLLMRITSLILTNQMNS